MLVYCHTLLFIFFFEQLYLGVLMNAHTWPKMQTNTHRHTANKSYRCWA